MSHPDDMNDSLSQLLLDQAERLFAEHAPRQVLEAADAGTPPEALWTALEEAGFPLALVPEEQGGAGLEVADGMRLVRLAAYHAAPVPLAETMLAAWLWSRAGGDPPDGEITLAPARPGQRAGIAGGILEGTADGVPWGARARHCLVFAQDASGNPCLALVGAQQRSARPGGRNIAFEPRDRLQFDRVQLAATALRPAPLLDSDGFLPLGAILRSQQMVGAMQRCLDHALGYAGERVQFGRPIAKFQAIQHMLAVAAGHLAAATAVADMAIDAMTAGETANGDLALAAAIAKARTGEAAGEVAAICHQVHGAMGFTQEHPLHYATRRLWSWRDEFGSEPFWQERIGRRVCAAGGEALWPMLAGA
ncbi:MAG: acyl-CoA dehydrogenase family protein [Sneathiellaceae bacterium]